MKPEVDREKKLLPFEDSIEWPEGSFDEIIRQMQDYKQKYSEVIDAKVQAVWYGYEECEYLIKGLIWENDEQQSLRVQEEEIALAEWQAREDARLSKLKAKEQEHLAKELAEYERLKAKFGKV